MSNKWYTFLYQKRVEVLSMYRLYIDYGKGYQNAEYKQSLEEVYKRLCNRNYERYILIKRENNTDEIVDFNIDEYDYKTLKKSR